MRAWTGASAIIYTPDGTVISPVAWKKPSVRKAFKAAAPAGWVLCRLHPNHRKLRYDTSDLACAAAFDAAKIEEISLKIALISKPQ